MKRPFDPEADAGPEVWPAPSFFKPFLASQTCPLWATQYSLSSPLTSLGRPRALLLTLLFVFLGSYVLLPLVYPPVQLLLPVNGSRSGLWDRSEANALPNELSPLAPSGDAPQRLRFPRTKRRLPQCVIVGVRKCGTRALLEFLNLHPHIVKATQEVHFFDDDSKYSLGLEWYRRKMPYSFPDQITVEKSPSYFVTENVPQRIFAMNPRVRLLLIVREPITRAISDYTQIQANKMAKGKSYASFESLAVTPEGRVNADYKALQISLYSNFLTGWFHVFPREQLHVVDGDLLVTDPLAEIRKIEAFLGLEHRVSRDNFYFNKTKGFYCVRNETTEKCLSEAKGRKHPLVAERVLEELKRYFEPFNQRFYDMIGQNFSWPTPPKP